jgi:L-ascorbate metabolism protein UlaG (beta-lactamase superfamily)
MKIKFLGHASFLITSEEGVRIITDPYKHGCFNGGIQYGPITEKADIVTISHEHDDHNETNIKGNPTFVRNSRTQTIRGITVTGVDVYHDTRAGKERGSNIIYNMSIDGVNVVHLGDLGHELSPDEVRQVGSADVLFVPIGGYFTMDAVAVDKVISALKPRVVIPMHFKTKKCGFPIAPLNDFIKGKKVEEKNGEVDITKKNLPKTTAIYVLHPTM